MTARSSFLYDLVLTLQRRSVGPVCSRGGPGSEGLSPGMASTCPMNALTPRTGSVVLFSGNRDLPPRAAFDPDRITTPGRRAMPHSPSHEEFLSRRYFSSL